ncbi:hypothetical protein QR680_009526 [Steinernema hermaphroditum]|uniref:CTCK domain-containing protein n=1 Tax=Steinernema hermaphroditum TaxID=289476 RepID=A0AA39IKM2_9BILA|nr:hypothetical protein QR680_009526 [Steinernema hermaphroditum]
MLLPSATVLSIFVVLPTLRGSGGFVEAQFDIRFWRPAIPPPPPPPHFRFIPFPAEEEVETPPPPPPPTTTTSTTATTTSTTKTTTPAPMTTRSTTTTTKRTTTTPPTTTSTSTTTTTTTITTAPTTTRKPTVPPTTVYVPPPPPPTPPPPQCDHFDEAALLTRMRDSGGFYSDVYMAVDVPTASRTFPDLGARSFTLEAPKYVCDAECERNWHHVRESCAQLVERVRLAGQAVASGAGREVGVGLRVVGEQEEGAARGVASGNRAAALGDQRRHRRSPSRPGSTVALECDIASANLIPSNGYHLCRTCRAIRQLGEDFFPRVLNEVICASEACLKGDGLCTQRFLPFKLLQNQGTRDCPKWRPTTIQLRTCCDCVVHPNSGILRYILE